MRRWSPATEEELAPARETPEDMPPLTFAIQRAAKEIATLPPGQFRQRFPELQFLDRKRTRYRDRRIAFARVLHVAAIHIDHERQSLRWTTRELAEEAGIVERRGWRVLDDFRDAGYLTPAKQRRVEEPKGKFRGCAVRRVCEPIFYRRLQLNIEAEAEKKRREQARADAAAQVKADADAQKIRELRRLPHIKTAPTVPAAALVVGDDEKAAAIRRIEEQLRRRRAADPSVTAPAPPPDPPPE